jgi:hypothetical protein
MKSYAQIACRRRLAIIFAAFAVCSGLMATAARAGGGDLAAGLLGGLAVGTIVGTAAAQPHYYVPYYAPAPVYVPAPHCWFEGQRVWDGYGYVIERVRVCE